MRIRRHLFPAAAVLLTFLVAGFLALAMLTIVAGGTARLPEALASEEVRFAIGLSLRTGSVSTLICMLLALPVAYALTRLYLPFRRLIEVVLELPLSLPYLVLGLALLIVFSSPWGKALRDAGFRVVFSANGIVMAQLIVNLPLAIRMVRTAFSEVDLRLEYIAATLGASRWKCFRTITLPLAKNSILGALVMVWSRAIGEFGATLMLVGVPRMKPETLPGSIYLNVSTGDNRMALASATILLIISALSLFLTGLLGRADRHGRLKGGEASW
jgi:molybdate transport system permease protein